MKTVIITIVILFIITIVLVQYLTRPKKTYPEYYKDVLITFKFPGEHHSYTKKAWLAVNDNLEYIWTLSDSSIIIPDDYVINWKSI